MIKEWFENRWVLLLLGFAVVGLIGTVIFRLITPQTTVVPKTEFITTNPSGNSSSFNNIRFIGTPPQPVESLPLATIQPSQTTLDYVRDQLIENYQLEQVVGVPGLWQGSDYTLSYNESEDEFLFYSRFIPQDSLLGDPTLAIDNAQGFVRLTFPNLELIAQRERVTYFQGLEELEEAPSSEAMAVEVPFAYTIQNIPVYLGHSQNLPIRIIVNSLNEVQKVVFQPQFLTFAPSEEALSVIGIDQALENINSRNEASIVSAYEVETGVFTLDEIREGTLDAVQLEYRADLESGTAYPFYRFSGELINEAGQTIQAEIITPAVETR